MTQKWQQRTLLGIYRFGPSNTSSFFAERAQRKYWVNQGADSLLVIIFWQLKIHLKSTLSTFTVFDSLHVISASFSHSFPFPNSSSLLLLGTSLPLILTSQNTVLPCQDQDFVGGQSYNCPYSTTTSESSVDVSTETWVSFWAAGLLDNREPQQAPQAQGKFCSSAFLVDLKPYSITCSCKTSWAGTL